MEIERVDVYEDGRFSQKVLYQHGCFLVRGAPYEVEIVSAASAVVRGSDQSVFPQLIDEFRFYTPYITRFFDEQGKLLAAYQPVQRFPVSLSQLQPSQFYVDRDKVTAIATFVRSWEDIVISVLPMGERYIALDGHTRLYYAVSKHWDQVYAVCHTVDDSSTTLSGRQSAGGSPVRRIWSYWNTRNTTVSGITIAITTFQENSPETQQNTANAGL